MSNEVKSPVDGKNILVGVSGGIAAYKTCALVSLLVKSGATVNVVMTENAAGFVGPLTFAALTGRPVGLRRPEGDEAGAIEHIELADGADVAIIAPATYNVIGKLASGIADDLLTTTFAAITSPVIIAPAMNVNMYQHPALQRNLGSLREFGYRVIEPDEGRLACGWQGPGRMPEPETLYEHILAALSPNDLEGKRILITAGPTREAIDPVRFISNRSSGKMGYALAAEAAARGAEVSLVSGPTDLAPPAGVKTVSVVSAGEMQKAVNENAADAEIIIMAAAVADFQPADPADRKLKKGDRQTDAIQLTRTPDILAGLGDNKGGKFLVGFAAETDDPIENAQNKLKTKNLDMIAVNDVTRSGAGFDCDTNIITLIFSDGSTEEISLCTKREAAAKILDAVAKRTSE